MSEPREIAFHTYIEPERAVVYIMHECTPDIFTKAQKWNFIEKSAYDELEKRRETSQQYAQEVAVHNNKLQAKADALAEALEEYEHHRHKSAGYRCAFIRKALADYRGSE